MAKEKKLDKKDITILNILQENARTSNVDIAKKLKMAPSAILERLRKLEKDGYIEGHFTRVNAQKVDYPLIAMVFVKTKVANFGHQLDERLSSVPFVQEVYRTAGEASYLLKVRARDTEHLADILQTEIGSVEGVASTNSVMMLKTVKQTISLPLVAHK